MNKKAIISVVSKQKENDDDIIEVVTPGKFYKKDGNYYVIYEETEISGMKGTTTTIKIDKTKFTLLRKGTTNTKMIFEEEFKDTILYSTPHGVLDMLIETRELLIDVDDCGGKISANYNMALSGQEKLNTQLEVIIKPQQDEWS